MSFGVSVQITGRRGISDLSTMKAIRIWETEVAPVLLAEIRREAPVSSTENSGRLRDSISFSRRSSGKGVSVEFTSSAPYAKYVQDGTSAHRIEPRTGNTLHWSQNGESVFALSVNHPGTKANPFVQRAVDRMLPWMRSRLRTTVEEELK